MERKRQYRNSKNNWLCRICNQTFRTKEECLDHKRIEGHQMNYSSNRDEKIKRQCKWCKRIKITTNSGNSLHEKLCEKNPNKSGHYWLNKNLSKETKEKLRLIFIERLKLTGKNRGANFNKKACDFIDKLNKEKNWNLQHALNGGEFTFCGYFLDGYDAKLNIVFEYDEPKHYINGELKEKDIIRQNIIIEKLNCDFWRYNESKKLLYNARVDQRKES